MKDGLIGEFAKEKIQNAIDILSEESPNYEKISNMEIKMRVYCL